jgi:hypothetical protein
MTAEPLPPDYQPVLRVTAHRVPDAEPPYDDGFTAPVRGALALAPWVAPAHMPALRLVPEPVDLDDDGTFDPVRTPRTALEDPAPRATVLARALLEALAGDRPLGQLMRWTTPEVFAQLEPLVTTRAQRPWAATLRKVLVAEPLPGIAEATAIVQRGARTGALALRLEGIDGRWVLTALQLA